MENSADRKWKRGDAIAILLLFLAVLALFTPALTGWLGIFHDDQAMAEFPWHYFVARHIQEGVIPLWEPDTWCGAIPFYARYYADTYYFPLWPFYLLTDLGDLTQAFWMLSLIPLLLHYWLAAAGMYVFGRNSLRLHALPAFLASWVYVFSPLFAYKYVAFPIVVVQAWLPWALCLVVSMSRRGALMKIIGLGVIFALMFFAAEPPYVGYSFLLVSVLSISLALRRYVAGRGVRAFREPIQLVLAVMLGCALAAVYILPVLEGMVHTEQHLSFTYEDMTSEDGSMPPVYLATLFIPDLFGTVSGFNNRNWVDTVTHGVRFWDANMSAGLFLTFLALTGFLLAVRWKSRPELRFWAILGGALWLFSILCMLGRHTPFYYMYYKVVPVLSDFPFPIRYVMIQAVVTAWLVGLGLECLLHREKAADYPAPRLVWGYLGLAVLATVLALFGLPGLRALMSGRLVIPGLDEIIRRGNLNWFIGRPILYFFIAGFLLVLAWRVLRGKQRVGAVAGLVMLETVVFTFVAFYFCIFRFHHPQPQQMRSLEPGSHPMIGRITETLAPLRKNSSLRWATDQPFHDNFARLEGSFAFMGYDMKPLERRFKKAFEEAYGSPVDWPLYWEFPRPIYPAFMGNMSVGYLLDSRSDNPFPGGESYNLESSPDFYLHHNPRALPRAFILDRIVSCSDEEAMEVLVKGDLRKAVFVDDSNQLSIFNDQVAASVSQTDYRSLVTDYRSFDPGSKEEYDVHFYELQSANRISGLDFSNPNKVKVDVDATSPAMLVLTEICYPGWEVRVDGEPAQLYRVNYLQRGVWLEGGPHHVEMVFHPRAWKAGMIISAIAWGIIISGVLGWVVRKIFKKWLEDRRQRSQKVLCN
jgi:Bacterial membrane protein YfhO